MSQKSQNSSLHFFADDLRNKTKGNTNAPPRSIRAADLDDNFKCVSIVSTGDIPYGVNYSKDGTSLSIFPPIPGGGTYYLALVDGNLTWQSFNSGGFVGVP